jgi:hypothetical protein
MILYKRVGDVVGHVEPPLGCCLDVSVGSDDKSKEPVQEQSEKATKRNF